MSMRSKPRWPAATQPQPSAKPIRSKAAGNLSFVRLYDLAARVTDALRANDIDSARTLMPDLRESHVAVLEALKNLEEWGLSTSMR